MDALSLTSPTTARTPGTSHTGPAATPRDVLPFTLAPGAPASGAGAQRPVDSVDLSATSGLRASRAADVASKLRARSMIGASVPGGVDFTVPPREPASARPAQATGETSAPAALPFYRHPGLANQVMTSVASSRMLDVQG